MVSPDQKRITLVTVQLAGYDHGGVGSATGHLALALAKGGHHVEILYASERQTQLSGEWHDLYSQAGVRVRTVGPPPAPVEPERFRRSRAVELALRDDPPDVVITHEAAAPGYAAMRLRRLGLAFERTLFVVFCHGTRRWVKEMNRNARVSYDVLAHSILEQASVELADVVVSPSAYMLDWMRRQGWQVPEAAFVIPLVTRSAAMGEARVDGEVTQSHRIERLAFFGRLEEGKGIRPFIDGVNAVEPSLLKGVELEFIAKPTKDWPPDRVRGLLSEGAKRALERVSFATDLDQRQALARLGRPGTLALMPSLGDNSPNAVYECLEHGIPFLVSGAGGAPELVAPDDRERVLLDPSASGVAKALERVLKDGEMRAARPSFDAQESLESWANVVATKPDQLEPVLSELSVDVLRGVREAAAPGNSPWVLLTDEEDVPDAQLLEMLVRAQVASEADVVTCGVRVDGTEHFFTGDAGGLGLFANEYGTVALIRRNLLGATGTQWPVKGEGRWAMLARLSCAGAKIVSVPLPLATTRVRPGTLENDPSEGLSVVGEFERALPGQYRFLARLAVGLATESQDRAPPTGRSLPRRALRRIGRLFR